MVDRFFFCGSGGILVGEKCCVYGIFLEPRAWGPARYTVCGLSYVCQPRHSVGQQRIHGHGDLSWIRHSQAVHNPS